MVGNLIINAFVGMILLTIAKKRNLKEYFAYFILALINPTMAGFALFARIFFISRKDKMSMNQNKKEDESYQYSQEEDLDKDYSEYEDEYDVTYKEVSDEELYDVLKEVKENSVEGTAESFLRDGFDYDGREFMTKEEKKSYQPEIENFVSKNEEIASEYTRKLEKRKGKEYIVNELMDKSAEYIAGKAKFESGKERKILIDMLLSKKYYLDKVERRFESFEEEALKREFEIFNDIEAEIEYLRRNMTKSS